MRPFTREADIAADFSRFAQMLLACLARALVEHLMQHTGDAAGRRYTDGCLCYRNGVAYMLVPSAIATPAQGVPQGCR
jgi:hypothetical protein